jgi:uncharacterized protein YjbJ (UPF0337 family)
MNWDRIGGNWRQLRGIATVQWSRLTGNYTGVVAGKRQQMLGEIQAAYGITRNANEKQLAEWRTRQHKADPIHK